MIELLIRLEDELYEQCKNAKLTEESEGFDYHIIKSVANGTPLPKGHGRIVDISKIEYMKVLNEAIHNKLSWKEAITMIKNSAPTIIEADKTEK